MNDLTANQKTEKANSKAVFESQQSVYLSPLPSPNDLKEYNITLPDAAERILTMAEKEQRHRIKLEQQQIEINKNLIKSEFSYRNRGQIIGGFIGIIGLSISAFLGYIGESAVASIIGGGTVVGLVTVFVTGKLKQKGKKETQ